MKKILIFVFLILLTTIEVKASIYKFMWDESTTTIEVPLGANLQNYIDIPRAKLYKDGMLLDDAKINYISTGDWLYLLTDVNTSKVGSYMVWYKAVENVYKPGQCQGYKCLVTFKVCDKEPPQIINCPDYIHYLIGNDKPNYLDMILVSDNSNNFEILVDDGLVRYDTPGEYVVNVHVSDGYNFVNAKINVIVEDSIGPIISFLGENNKIIIGKDEDVEIISYFQAIDKIDGDVTSSIQYESFKTDKEKEFNLDVSFSDKNGNISTINITIAIVDLNEVSMEIYEDVLILNYAEDYTKAIEDNLKSCFLGKNNVRDEVEINYNNLCNEVGKYKVSYIYDNNGKYSEISCEVVLLSENSPVILIENINVTKGQTVNILDYISVIDESDPEINEKIVYDASTVDWYNSGTYIVKISVTNSSNLTSTENLYVIVENPNLFDDTQDNYNLYLIGIVAIFLVLGTVFLVYKKRKKTML